MPSTPTVPQAGSSQVQHGRPVVGGGAQRERGGEHFAGEEILQDHSSLAVGPGKQLRAPGLQDVEDDQVGGAFGRLLDGAAAPAARTALQDRKSVV
jgi:hypothetical protein